MSADDPAGARAAAALWLEYARRLSELAPPPPKARPQVSSRLGHTTSSDHIESALCCITASGFRDLCARYRVCRLN